MKPRKAVRCARDQCPDGILGYVPRLCNARTWVVRGGRADVGVEAGGRRRDKSIGTGALPLALRSASTRTVIALISAFEVEERFEPPNGGS